MGRRIPIRQLKQEALEVAQQTKQTLANAQNVMSHADRAILQVAGKAMETLAKACDVFEQVRDGKATITLQVAGRDWPVGARLDFADDGEDDEDDDSYIVPPEKPEQT